MGYSNIVTVNQPNKDGGYKNKLLFSKVSDITTWQRPTSAGLVSGDTLAIASAHTWAAGKAVSQWETRVGSFRHTMETGGDEGAKSFVYVASCDVLGDSASLLEQLKEMINDNIVLFLKDANCLPGEAYVQLGDDCNPISLSTAEFDSNTNSTEQITGQKRYVLNFRSKAKFFYNAAVDVTP